MSERDAAAGRMPAGWDSRADLSDEYEWIPLRLPPDLTRISASTRLSIEAEYRGWELTRVRLYTDGSTAGAAAPQEVRARRGGYPGAAGAVSCMMYRALRRALFLVAPERIHTWVFAVLRAVTAPAVTRASRWRGGWRRSDPVLASTVFGVRFPGPLGLAAGFDKDGLGLRTLGRAGLRIRRGRHRDRAGAARQPAAADVPAARRPGAAQPDGVQQPRRGRAGAAAGAAHPRRADRGQHRQDQDHPGRARRRRLRRERAAGRAAGRVPGGQCQLAEHAGPARPAGRRVAAPDPGRGPRRDHHAGAGEDRARPVRLRHRRDRRSGSRIGAGRHRRHQHDGVPRRTRHPGVDELGAGGISGPPVARSGRRRCCAGCTGASATGWC